MQQTILNIQSSSLLQMYNNTLVTNVADENLESISLHNAGYQLVNF